MLNLCICGKAIRGVCGATVARADGEENARYSACINGLRVVAAQLEMMHDSLDVAGNNYGSSHFEQLMIACDSMGSTVTVVADALELLAPFREGGASDA